jgi:hypothetical protein
MSHELLSQIESGCYGKMKVEDGKIVFECVTNHNTSPLSYPLPCYPPPPSVPAPSAPPLVEDNRLIDELRDELRETKERLTSLEKRVQQLFKIRARSLHENNKTFENLLAGGVVHLENELEAASIEAAAPPNPAASTPPYMLLPTTTKFSLVALQSRSPETAFCDPTRRHHYLSDVDFQKVFNMSAIDFGKLAGWMQIEIKKRFHLF